MGSNKKVSTAKVDETISTVASDTSLVLNPVIASNNTDSTKDDGQKSFVNRMVDVESVNNINFHEEPEEVGYFDNNNTNRAVGRTAKLRVFECFSGIGSQHKALKNIGIDYEIVGMSEWDVKSLISYKAIHYPDIHVEIPSKQVVRNYLDNFTFSMDGKEAKENLKGVKKELESISKKPKICLLRARRARPRRGSRAL